MTSRHAQQQAAAPSLLPPSPKTVEVSPGIADKAPLSPARVQRLFRRHASHITQDEAKVPLDGSVVSDGESADAAETDTRRFTLSRGGGDAELITAVEQGERRRAVLELAASMLVSVNATPSDLEPFMEVAREKATAARSALKKQVSVPFDLESTSAPDVDGRSPAARAMERRLTLNHQKRDSGADAMQELAGRFAEPKVDRRGTGVTFSGRRGTLARASVVATPPEEPQHTPNLPRVPTAPCGGPSSNARPGRLVRASVVDAPAGLPAVIQLAEFPRVNIGIRETMGAAAAGDPRDLTGTQFTLSSAPDTLQTRARKDNPVSLEGEDESWQPSTSSSSSSASKSWLPTSASAREDRDAVDMCSSAVSFVVFPGEDEDVEVPLVVPPTYLLAYANEMHLPQLGVSTQSVGSVSGASRCAADDAHEQVVVLGVRRTGSGKLWQYVPPRSGASVADAPPPSARLPTFDKSMSSGSASGEPAASPPLVPFLGSSARSTTLRSSGAAEKSLGSFVAVAQQKMSRVMFVEEMSDRKPSSSSGNSAALAAFSDLPLFRRDVFDDLASRHQSLSGSSEGRQRDDFLSDIPRNAQPYDDHNDEEQVTELPPAIPSTTSLQGWTPPVQQQLNASGPWPIFAAQRLRQAQLDAILHSLPESAS